MLDVFFAGADEMNAKLQNGEMSGSSEWPLQGTATFKKLEKTLKNGNPYLAITLSMVGVGNKEFLIRVPTASDKDAAKYMGMQRRYKTVFVLADADPSVVSVGEAFAAAAQAVGKQVHFKLEEYESVSQKNGKTYTNQSLSSLQSTSQGMDI